MKTRTTVPIGVCVIAAALISSVFKARSDHHTNDDSHCDSLPRRTKSLYAQERRLDEMRRREHDPEREFAAYLSKIKPHTDFEDTSEGYFQGYLLAREAEKVIRLTPDPDYQETAKELLERSYAYFLGVREVAPDWKDQMVLARLDKARSSLRTAYFSDNKRR